LFNNNLDINRGNSPCYLFGTTRGGLSSRSQKIE